MSRILKTSPRFLKVLLIHIVNHSPALGGLGQRTCCSSLSPTLNSKTKPSRRLNYAGATIMSRLVASCDARMVASI